MNAVRAARRTRRQLRALMFLAFALGSIGIACRREAPPPSAVEPGTGAAVASTPARAATDPPRAATTVPLPSPAESPSSVPAGGLLVPVQGVTAEQLHDTFTDARSSGRLHDAIDIMAPAGTPVIAVADGTVEKLFESRRGGTTLYQFNPERTHAYYYAHLQGYAPGIAERQVLRRGQVIGYVGSTGNADPQAPHLHFAVFALGPERRWWEGVALNPYPLLRASR